MNKTEAINSLASTDGFFRHWMSYNQRVALTQALGGEEGNYFTNLLTDLKDRIEAMPQTYQTGAIASDDKIVHLHYFIGSVDAWIVEKDMGDCAGGTMQLQAYGKATLFGEGFNGAEWGYISIHEYIEFDAVLDLYWTPKTVRECK